MDMNDEYRGHDPNPTDEERAWLEIDPVRTAGRIAIILILAVAIAGYVSYALDKEPKPAVASNRHG
jgi:hypothetical protein